jgi:hypothetical protein
MNILDHPLFTEQQVYTVAELNAVINRLAGNDEILRMIAETLQQVITTTPGDVPTPAELQAAIDAMYASGSVIARNWVVDPPDRTLQEISNLYEIEPFASLIEGVKLQPTLWLPLLRLFGMLRGMIYLVEDGPDYDVAPTYIKDGSFFFTACTNDAGDHLLIDGTGTPLNVSGLVYRPLPIGVTAITLIEFMLRRLELKRLRDLYRISAFEAGIDNKYDSAAPHDFIANVYKSDPTTDTKRFPCGFTSAGELLFLRSQAGKYRGDNLNIFREGQPNGGVEERVMMAESTIQTPAGLFRLPKCVLRWDHLITDGDRTSDFNLGDPVFFIGLKVTLSLVKRTDYSNGTATPDMVSDLGCGPGVIPIERNAVVGEIPNHPTHLTGTKAQRYPLLTAEGHEQGRLIGFMQQDGLTKFGQYAQIHLDVVAVPLHGRPFFDAATIVPAGQIDEIGKMGEFGTDTDVAPWRAFGIGPRRALDVVAAGLPGFTLDVDQGIFTEMTRTADEATQVCILPIGLHLAKNGNLFGLDNLNGCQTRFRDAWAIREITSAQISLSTIIFADENGDPEAFPDDFLGAELTIWKADGSTIKTTIVERVGDRLARLPATIVAQVTSGDIATIDRRKPSSSLDDTYNREVGVASFVDLRLRVRRLVDSVVTPSADGILSPSPSPALPWTALSHSRPDSLVRAAMEPYAGNVAGIACKLRWQYAQKFIAMASQRQDLIDLAAGTSTDLGNFLVRYVANYEANKNHEWIVGESGIIHYPAKEPVTKISLRRYSPPVLPGQDDGITIETVKDWGPVPVLTKYLRAADNIRYPMRFVKPMVFASERSFQIPGHTKLAGSFRLQPEDTWIVDNTVTFQLFQTQNKNGVISQVQIGSFDIDWTRATSFSNATGVFRIDGDAQYNPATGYVVINYNQIVDFTVDEPGSLAVNVVYHDLSEVHPIYKLDIGSLGLEVAHLFEAKGFSVSSGTVAEMPDTIRLEGISLSDGSLYLRFNREDTFKVIAARGAFRTKWVLRGLSWITIGEVTNNEQGQPIEVAYTADSMREVMTVSTLLEKDSRCKQVYLPCNTKYGWVDLGQTNIHTESLPQNDSPKFGFFEKDSVKGTDTALTIPGPVNFAFKPSDIDYRFLEPYTGPTGLEGIKSVAIVRNAVTGEVRPLVGVYRQANGGGEPTALFDEIGLADLTQDTVFITDSELTSDWILDFAGVLVAVNDDPAAAVPVGRSKLMLVGYWYGGHTVTARVGTFTRFRSDTVQFSSPVKNAAYWRIGDVPMSFLYRGNTLLWASRKRPL